MASKKQGNYVISNKEDNVLYVHVLRYLGGGVTQQLYCFSTIAPRQGSDYLHSPAALTPPTRKKANAH